MRKRPDIDNALHSDLTRLKIIFVVTLVIVVVALLLLKALL